MRCVSLRSKQKYDTWIGFQWEFAWRNPTTPALWLLSGGKININIYDSSELLWCFVCAVCMLSTCGVTFPQLGSLNWIESTISSAAHPHSTDSWQWMRHWFDASSIPRKVWELLDKWDINPHTNDIFGHTMMGIHRPMKLQDPACTLRVFNCHVKTQIFRHDNDQPLRISPAFKKRVCHIDV